MHAAPFGSSTSRQCKTVRSCQPNQLLLLLPHALHSLNAIIMAWLALSCWPQHLRQVCDASQASGHIREVTRQRQLQCCWCTHHSMAQSLGPSTCGPSALPSERQAEGMLLARQASAELPAQRQCSKPVQPAASRPGPVLPTSRAGHGRPRPGPRAVQHSHAST
jgi:hypothetical protein